MSKERCFYFKPSLKILAVDTTYVIIVRKEKGGFIMPVNVNQDTCIGCGACVGVCPVGALSMNDESKSVCDEGTCIDCGACVATCPVEAISQ